ncbi:MAG TPA: iron-containing redox enzyme family protein [Gemmatimonadaceae bacterium]|nr:iron-containing redox enzyme family protein [Gemmatimonadaceae bacterium]
MSSPVVPHPRWVKQLDASLEPLRQRILELDVVVHASENRLGESAIRNFMVEFYPIIRDFPGWLETLLERTPEDGLPFFRENLRVERKHAMMWQAMGEGFGVPLKRFHDEERGNEAVEEFHAYLTGMGETGTFASAVAATNYAVEGVAQGISAKALEGLQHHPKLGERGRWWLEEHAKYDDEHPVMALELIKACVGRGEDEPELVSQAAKQSLELMHLAMDASYHD